MYIYLEYVCKKYLTSHLWSGDVWARLVLEHKLGLFCARLHLAEWPSALALTAVVGVGERAVKGTGHGVAVHAEQAVQVGVALDVAAESVQRVLLQRGTPERCVEEREKMKQA